MTLEEAIIKGKEGYIIMLPNFTGYFTWNYSTGKLIAYNGDWKSDVANLDVKLRNDFYYII